MIASTDSLLSQFKALADPVRARLVALCGAVDCSVSELTKVTGQSQPRVSQHLKQLCTVGLLERFKDGHFVYYRVRTSGDKSAVRRQLISMLPKGEPQFQKDIARLRELRADDNSNSIPLSDHDRSLHRALVELTVARPVGDLLDVGCGQGRILKLLASRAQRSVGVDIDSNSRRLARAQLLLAGTPNCTLRQGSMHALPFEDSTFDTVILDDVLNIDADPELALREALRLLSEGGRILVLRSIAQFDVRTLSAELASWAAKSNIRLASPRAIPNKNPSWLLAVATPAERASAVA